MRGIRKLKSSKIRWRFWAGLFLFVVFSYNLTTLLIGPYYSTYNPVYPSRISPDGEYMVVGRYARTERTLTLYPYYYYMLHIPSGESWDIDDHDAWEYAADRQQVTYHSDGLQFTFSPTDPETLYDITNIESSRGHQFGFNIVDPDSDKLLHRVTYRSIYHFHLPLGLRLTAPQALTVMVLGSILSVIILLSSFFQPSNSIYEILLAILIIGGSLILELARFAVKID